MYGFVVQKRQVSCISINKPLISFNSLRFRVHAKALTCETRDLIKIENDRSFAGSR